LIRLLIFWQQKSTAKRADCSIQKWHRKGVHTIRLVTIAIKDKQLLTVPFIFLITI
jgi:hypothetical protein